MIWKTGLKNNRGFTIIEMIISMTLFAIITTSVLMAVENLSVSRIKTLNRVALLDELYFFSEQLFTGIKEGGTHARDDCIRDHHDECPPRCREYEYRSYQDWESYQTPRRALLLLGATRRQYQRRWNYRLWGILESSIFQWIDSELTLSVSNGSWKLLKKW